MAATNAGKRPVAIVTGGTRGVGLATATKLAASGFDLAICGRDMGRLAQAVDTIQSVSDQVRVSAVTLDLNEPTGAAKLIDQVEDQWQRIDLLVNNAAVAPLASLEQTSDDAFEQAININIRSVFYLTRRVWPIMMKQQSGTVINVSSLAAVDPFPGFSVYGASKAWLDLFTVALGSEGKSHGIRVFSIRCGAIETEMLRELFPDLPADQAIAPERVADVIWALFQDELTPASGQAIVVKA